MYYPLIMARTAYLYSCELMIPHLPHLKSKQEGKLKPAFLLSFAQRATIL